MPTFDVNEFVTFKFRTFNRKNWRFKFIELVNIYKLDLGETFFCYLENIKMNIIFNQFNIQLFHSTYSETDLLSCNFYRIGQHMHTHYMWCMCTIIMAAMPTIVNHIFTEIISMLKVEIKLNMKKECTAHSFTCICIHRWAIENTLACLVHWICIQNECPMHLPIGHKIIEMLNDA